MKRFLLAALVFAMLLASCADRVNDAVSAAASATDEGLAVSKISDAVENPRVDITLPTDTSSSGDDCGITLNYFSYRGEELEEGYSSFSKMFGDVIKCDELDTILTGIENCYLSVKYTGNGEGAHEDHYTINDYNDLTEKNCKIDIFPTLLQEDKDMPVWQCSTMYKRDVLFDQRREYVLYGSSDEYIDVIKERLSKGDHTSDGFGEVAVYRYIKEDTEIYMVKQSPAVLDYEILFKLDGYVFRISCSDYKYKRASLSYGDGNTLLIQVPSVPDGSEGIVYEVFSEDDSSIPEPDASVLAVYDYYAELADNSTESSYIVRLLKDVVANHK